MNLSSLKLMLLEETNIIQVSENKLQYSHVAESAANLSAMVLDCRPIASMAGLGDVADGMAVPSAAPRTPDVCKTRNKKIIPSDRG
jgi:hypothetical protein